MRIILYMIIIDVIHFLPANNKTLPLFLIIIMRQWLEYKSFTVVRNKSFQEEEVYLLARMGKKEYFKRNFQDAWSN